MTAQTNTNTSLLEEALHKVASSEVPVVKKVTLAFSGGIIAAHNAAVSVWASVLDASTKGLLAGTAPGHPFPKPDPTSGSLPVPMGDASGM